MEGSDTVVKFLNILVVILISVALTGCGAHFVASDKTLGIPANKKPVVGVLDTGFVLNHEGNPFGPILGARYGEEVTQFLKDEGIDARVIKLSEIQTRWQLAEAVNKYNSITDYRKRFPADFTFGDMTSDFNDLGIDMLVILSGSAGNASIPAWVQVSTLVAFGTMSLRTPSSETIATAVSRSGKPLYNDCTTFTRMGRRDFGNDSHRKAMAEAVADGIRGNSF
jgi:hypothetical protein